MTIFSMEIENQLIQLGEAASRCQWEIGYIVWDYLEKCDYSAKMQIYADAAKLTGKSIRSIRRYAAVVEFYPDRVVEQYKILPFEYFAQAMTYGDRVAGRWQELLDACLKQMDRTGGGLPGVDWMRVYADPGIITEPEVDVQLPQEPPEWAETPYPCEIDTLEPILTPAAAATTVRRLNQYYKALVEAVNVLASIEGDVLCRFVAVLDQLQAAINEIETCLTVRQK